MGSSVPDTASFLHTTNPEVFVVKPRPGGLINIVGDDSPFKVNHIDSKVSQRPSRDFRIHIALDDDTFSDKSEESATLPNPYKDAMYLLGTTISTIVMLAADFSEIPEEHLLWTRNFLECVQDDYGHHPPNVQGILNHIRERTSGEGDGEGEVTVRTITRVKMGPKPEAAPVEEAPPEE